MVIVSVRACSGRQADSLQNRADALLSRADTIDGLIQATQRELSEKRKDFEHYKNRAQTEMAISLQARFVAPGRLEHHSDPPAKRRTPAARTRRTGVMSPMFTPHSNTALTIALRRRSVPTIVVQN